MSSNDDLPEIDFSTFLLSLCTSAMMHLGDASDESGRTHRNLPLAKETIDILAMLAKKTEGNLSEDERKLLEEQLYTLRLRYVEACGGKG